MVFSKFDESKVKRDKDGQFAKKASTAIKVPDGFKLNLTGKTAPSNWKFYKPGYKPKGWDQIKGTNSKLDGKKLWELKKNNAFENDYQFYLYASKLSSAYKKSHPTDKEAASHNQIINAAFRYELEETGFVKLGGNEAPGAVPAKNGPVPPPTVTHAKTSGGLKVVSKFAPPGTLTTFVKTMPGATGSKLYKDDKGDEWLVKAPKTGSNAYSNSNFLVDLEHSVALIQNKGGIRSANSHKTTLDGKKVLAQKMFGNVKTAFPGGPKIATMSEEDKIAMLKNQIFDWMISNHDTHTGNFLKDEQGIVAIDKGQAFKFFGKDKLDWNYAPVTPLGEDKPTYQTMFKDYVAGKGDLPLDSPEIESFITRLENIDDEEYAEMLRPYAETAAKEGKLSITTFGDADIAGKVETFLDLAIERKNNLANDFETFYGKAEAERAKNLPGPGKLGGDPWADKPGQISTAIELTQDMKDMKQSLLDGDYESVSDFIGDVMQDQTLTKPQYEYLTSWAKNLEEHELPSATKPATGKGKVRPKKAVKAKSGEITSFSQMSVGDDVDILMTDKNFDLKPTPAKVKDVGSGSAVFSTPEGDVTLYNDVLYKEDDSDEPMVSWHDPSNGPVFEAKKTKKIKIEGELASFESVEVGDQLFHGGTKKTYEVTAKNANSVIAKNVDIGGIASFAKISQSFSNGYLQWGKNTVAGKYDNDPVLKDLAFVEEKMAEGYKIAQHPDSGKWGIQKPNGAWSLAKDSVTVKEWESPQAALDSSTMTKYKAQAVSAANYTASYNIPTPTSVAGYPDYSAQDMVNAYGANAAEMQAKYASIKTKILAGESDSVEFADFKMIHQKVVGSKKAEGAAQIVEDLEDGFGASYTVSATNVAPVKTTKMPTPAFKKKGGAPPALEKATGPNALGDGASLWEMKKQGKFESDDELWKHASKMSNAYKAKAKALNPGVKLQSGVHYSSPNQIRNVAMRMEYDETGDVTWVTSVSKTSAVESGSTKANTLHEHVPTVPNSKHHYDHDNSVGYTAWSDTSKPAGSYENPHCFKAGDTAALRAYGQKYTKHDSWPSNQKQAWYNFSGSYSGMINGYFRLGEAASATGNAAQAKQLSKDLVDAFKNDNNKPLEDWTVVTRGTNGGWEVGIGNDAVTFDEIAAMKGKIVRNKCPVSSSLRTRPAFGGSMRITYKLPPGFKAVHILGKSAHPGEDEVLLPPGMAYKIIDVKPGNHNYKTEVLVEVVDVKLPEIT